MEQEAQQKKCCHPHPPFGMPPFGKPCFPMARIGAPAPAFKTGAWDNGSFREISLEEYKGKWVVLFFYPADFTFVCPTEICSFSDANDNFAKINAVVLGCSPDSQYCHREFALKERKQGGLAPCKIPLLGDISHKLCRSYGCYIECGPSAGTCYRATYIIDAEGIIRHISMNDLGVGRNIDEVLRLVQALQYNQENGEVCPMNWKPGRKTMKPEVGDASVKKYFEEELGKNK